MSLLQTILHIPPKRLEVLMAIVDEPKEVFTSLDIGNHTTIGIFALRVILNDLYKTGVLSREKLGSIFVYRKNQDAVVFKGLKWICDGMRV